MKLHRCMMCRLIYDLDKHTDCPNCISNRRGIRQVVAKMSNRVRRLEDKK